MLVDLVADTSAVVHALNVGDDNDLKVRTEISLDLIPILGDHGPDLERLEGVVPIRRAVPHRDQAGDPLVELLTDQPLVPLMEGLPTPDE